MGKTPLPSLPATQHYCILIRHILHRCLCCVTRIVVFLSSQPLSYSIRLWKIDCSSLQTKELIAEIELLEEEIANREQHVLTLYRSIFDQCMSGPSSGQSSGISSPAHTKSIATRTRRQPSIISSAFCSSKKLPLQPFHIMESLSESGKTKNMLKAKIKHQSFSSETLDIHPASYPPDPKKVTQTSKKFS